MRGITPQAVEIHGNLKQAQGEAGFPQYVTMLFA
jgi:hypothetical protein